MAKDAEDARIATWLDRFRGYEVRTVHETEGGTVGAWYLREPGSRMGSVLVALTPEGVVLTGDGYQGPGNALATGLPKYGLGWWLGRLSPSYVGEKCLRKGWHVEAVRERLRDDADDAANPDMLDEEDLGGANRDIVVSTLREMAGADGAYLHSPEALENHIDWISAAPLTGAIYHAMGVGPEDIYEYCSSFEPDELAWLCAVQRKFAEMWPARRPLDEAGK